VATTPPPPPLAAPIIGGIAKETEPQPEPEPEPAPQAETPEAEPAPVSEPASEIVAAPAPVVIDVDDERTLELADARTDRLHAELERVRADLEDLAIKSRAAEHATDEARDQLAQVRDEAAELQHRLGSELDVAREEIATLQASLETQTRQRDELIAA